MGLNKGKDVRDVIERYHSQTDPLEFWDRVARGLAGVPLEPEDSPAPAAETTTVETTSSEPRPHEDNARASRRRRSR